MEWFSWIHDPTAWIGLATLVVLEIVLGIDNLIFIAILADKLPPHQRDKARITGLSLALVMRLGLLTIMSWLVTLTTPLFSVAMFTFSGRDLILLLGGFFLLFKATMELHERMEGQVHTGGGSRAYAGFGIVILQILILDMVFSLDSVITAVGMVEHLSVMMIAVIIAMVVMIVASKPLTRFVNAHPTVVVLCLAFLLMIGFALVADGLGFAFPKGYLYAAIGFSIMIEFFNQMAKRNSLKLESTLPMRERASRAVLTLLRAKHPITEDDISKEDSEALDSDSQPSATAVAAQGVNPAEHQMVTGALTLTDRSVASIMTPRNDISWINLEDSHEQIKKILTEVPHSFFPVCQGNLDNVLGIGRARDLLADILLQGSIQSSSLRDAIKQASHIDVLSLVETLRQAHGQLVLLMDEKDKIQGLVTPLDLLEAIAGDFPDEDEIAEIVASDDGSWLVTGKADLLHLEQTTQSHIPTGETYTNLEAYLLEQFGRLPKVGEFHEASEAGLRFEIAEIKQQSIARVRVRKLLPENP